MFNYRKIFSIGLLSFLAFGGAYALPIEDAINNLDIEQLSLRSKKINVKDLKGTFIGYGFTAGGDQETSSADVLTITFNKDGTGTIPFLSIRTFDGVTTTYFNIPAQIAPVPVLATLNTDGTGRLTIFNLPAAGFNSLFDIVVNKKNGDVTRAYALKVGVVDSNGTPIDSPFANEIKSFVLTRQ